VEEFAVLHAAQELQPTEEPLFRKDQASEREEIGFEE